MSWKFWQKPPEKRQSQPFSDAIVSAIASQAAGNLTGDPTAVGAVEMASGAYSRAFAGCTVQAADRVKRALTPAVLGSIARSMIRRGESVYLIEIEGGEIRLQPVGSWDIRGGPNPGDWFVRADIFGPSGNLTKFVPYSQVVSCKYAYDPATPWFGLSPLAFASLTGSLGAAIQTRLGQEASGPSGYVMPLPIPPKDDDTDDDEDTAGPLTAIKADLANSKGRTSFVESSRSMGGDESARPLKDWESQRYGFDAPDTMRILNTDVGRDILGCCGVPVSLFADADGTAARESWRRFVMGSVESVSRLVEAELSAKLETPVKLDFQNLWAHDQAGRSASFAKLVSGGMDLERAAKLSGVLVAEE